MFIIAEQAYKTTNSMAKGSTWQADSRSAGQEIPRLVWNRKVHCCVHKSPRDEAILRSERFQSGNF
jgi:hypothetical protein